MVWSQDVWQWVRVDTKLWRQQDANISSHIISVWGEKIKVSRICGVRLRKVACSRPYLRRPYGGLQVGLDCKRLWMPMHMWKPTGCELKRIKQDELRNMGDFVIDVLIKVAPMTMTAMRDLVAYRLEGVDVMKRVLMQTRRYALMIERVARVLFICLSFTPEESRALRETGKWFVSADTASEWEKEEKDLRVWASTRDDPEHAFKEKQLSKLGELSVVDNDVCPYTLQILQGAFQAYAGIILIREDIERTIAEKSRPPEGPGTIL